MGKSPVSPIDFAIWAVVWCLVRTPHFVGFRWVEWMDELVKVFWATGGFLFWRSNVAAFDGGFVTEHHTYYLGVLFFILTSMVERKVSRPVPSKEGRFQDKMWPRWLGTATVLAFSLTSIIFAMQAREEPHRWWFLGSYLTFLVYFLAITWWDKVADWTRSSHKSTSSSSSSEDFYAGALKP